jgi:hypothetical protein
MKLELPGPIAENAGEFTGRAWLLEHLLNWLARPDERLFLLTGGPGTGKSMVMAWLAGAGPAPSGPSTADHRAQAQLTQFRSQVGGAHFCQATSGNIEPKLFAENLARQLTETVSGFSTALARGLSDRVQITGWAQVSGDVAADASVTGVTIKNLNLGDLGEEVSFNRALREPLKRLYADGFDEPLILLVDGLDEAATYTGAITIVQLLTRLADLPPQVRVLASTRPDPRILYLFPEVTPFDLIDHAPTDTDDVYDYVSTQLAGRMELEAAQALARRIADASDGVFLYAHLVLRELLSDQPIRADRALAPLPKGLSNLYVGSLNRLLGPDRSRWYSTYRPLLGLISVAQGAGLTQTQLRSITNTEVAEPLEVVQQYLDGQFPQGPFRPFHRSFTELLHNPANLAYGIPPSPMHWQVADHYWQQGNGTMPWRHWDAYGIHYTPTHLAEAALASDPPTQRQSTERLVDLMADAQFQQFHHENVNDLAALQRDLERAVASAASDGSLDTLWLVPKSAPALVRFRRQHLRPEPVFKLARQREVQAAVRRLDLFEVDPDWYQACLLIIAWLAAGHPEAAALRDHVAAELRTTPPLPLLLARLDHRMGGASPWFPPLPPPPEPALARAIVDRMGGMGADEELLASRGLYRPIVSEGFPSRELVAMGGFLARDDAPLLVAYAAHPEPGEADPDRFLREYVGLHASYNYPVYRNGSLLQVLAAVLRHPSDVWIERMLAVLAEAALAGGGADFEGAFPIGVLTWRSRLGQPNAIAELETRRQQCLDVAARLIAGHGRDIWGRQSRRLGALAEGLALLHGRGSDAEQLLQAALRIPYGFAGFRSAACLSLAESIHVCKPQGAAIEEAQQQALEAAHHINDPSFLARSTARVNAMIQRWPLGGSTDAAIQRLINDPSSAELAAVHRVLDQYPLRTGGGAFPLDELLAADTLEALARVFQRPLSSFVRLNPGIPPQQRLAAGMPVNVPDPGFPPRLAARFTAEILADHTRPPEDRVERIRALVPVAAVDPTALDAVLGRLVLAAAMTNRDDLPELLDRIGSIADESRFEWTDNDTPTVRLPG